MKRMLLLCMLMVMSLSISAQGLGFLANERTLEERTSLEIPCEDLLAKKRFEMSFSLSVRNFDTFGYIFLLEDAKTRYKYSLTRIYVDGEHCAFKFNTDGVSNHFSLELSNESLAFRWIPVSFVFDLEKQELTVSIDGHDEMFPLPGLSSPFSPRLYFGKHDYILDIPSFAIKDLRLAADRRTVRIPLNEISGCNVHSAAGKVVGHVVNPVWLTNDSYYWKELFEFRSAGPAGIQYDPVKQCLVAFTQDSLWRYDLRGRKLASLRCEPALPVRLQLATSFVNTDDGRLYAYELNNLPIGDVTVAALDIDSGCWSVVGKASLPVQLHHHDGFWDSGSGRYVVFGGFGNKRFNNTFLSYDPMQDRWDTIPHGGSISPRYFSGMAVSDDYERLYIYGGMGNSSGDQSVGRQYLHDLYMFDRRSSEVTRLWDKGTEQKFVAVRNMLLSPDEKYITALCYQEYISDASLRMVRFSVEDGTAQLLADGVPIRSGEIATNANLYYNDYMSEYYCTVVEFDKDGNTVTKAFVLSAPAVGQEVMELYGEKVENEGGGWLWIVSVLSAVLIWTYVIVTCRRRRRRSLPDGVPEQVDGPSTASTEAAVKAPEEEPVPIPVEVVPEHSAVPSSNAIFLFGQFTVLDRCGRDITYMFSSRLKQVFVYLLINSCEAAGVLSSAMNEVFWADKSHDKAKNLKGVTINQIRKCLAELDGITLEYEKGYFRIAITDSCYCDYFRYRTLKKVPEAYHELGALLMRGKLLDSFGAGLLDRTKQVEEDFLVAFLPIEIERLYRGRKYSAAVRYCRLLLAIDPVNEFALAYAVKSLELSVSSQEALILYSMFVREYKELMGEDYPVSFSSLISSDLPKLQD